MYIADMIEQKLKEGGRDYDVYTPQRAVPGNLSDLPKGKITAIINVTPKGRVELIEQHNVNYSVTIDFFVPSDLRDLFQEDISRLKDLEAPTTFIDYTVKMIFPLSSQFISQTVAGEYWVTASISGEVFEMNDLTLGDDIEIYYMLNEDECTPPIENPNDYIGIPKTAEDSSVWTGVIDFYDWQETTEVLSPTYTVAKFSDLPQAEFGESAKVANTFVWDVTTTHIGDYAFIRSTLADLGTPTILGVKAVATGHVMVNSSDIEWNSGYEIQWISQVSLDAPYDYDIVSPSTLPTPTSNGLKGRIRTLAWQSNTFHFSDYGYIKTSLGALPTGIAHLGKKATVIGYTPVLTTVTEYNAALVKADILTDDSWTPSNVDDMLFNFQNQYDMYFSDLPEFAYQGAIKFNNGVTISYWKFDIPPGNANVYYTYNVTDTDYFISQTIETKPRITVSVTEGWNNNDVWQRIQVEHFTVFNALVDFYDDLGVIRVNTGFGYEYHKLTQQNRLGNLYYISIVETYKYYEATPSASWHFINSGEGELIDIESFEDGVNFMTEVENIYNESGFIKNQQAVYTGANTPLQFKKLLNPSKTFDNLLLEARHTRTSPKKITIKFKYNSLVYQRLSAFEFIEDFYITNISRTRSKRSFGMISVTLTYGDLL
jgi:hypothetical protein